MVTARASAEHSGSGGGYGSIDNDLALVNILGGRLRFDRGAVTLPGTPIQQEKHPRQPLLHRGWQVILLQGDIANAADSVQESRVAVVPRSGEDLADLGLRWFLLFRLNTRQLSGCMRVGSAVTSLLECERPSSTLSESS